MPSAVAPNPRANLAPADDLDDLFNYDAGVEDAFNEREQQQTTRAAGGDSNQTTGLDEEVKIARKRRPIAKLDEDRLLSEIGIPKLRKISKDRLRFKGKGHEFSDMARLLSTYQLWLDDLFPKAKFTDGLSMIEKLGHKKRIQIMRKEWINEGKPKPVDEDDDGDAFMEPNGNNEESRDQPNVSIPVEESQAERSDEDAGAAHTSDSDRLARSDERVPEEPDEDELDALLADEANNAPASLFGGPTTTNKQPAQPLHDDFEDEEDAMAGMGW